MALGHSNAGPALVAALMGAVLTCAGCVVESKPTITLPTPTDEVVLTVVARLGAAQGLRDVQHLAVTDETLLVADTQGLFAFDVGDPSAPGPGVLVDARPVHKVAAYDTRVHTIDIGQADRLRVFDIATPDAPQLLADVPAITRTFGGLAAQPGLVWQAVGSNPPSRVYPGDLPSADNPCSAPDRERGVMDVWLFGAIGFASTHFDDYAGDSLRGNGGYGVVVYDVTLAGDACPRLEPHDVVLAPTHSLNRSAFERAASSDLQVDYDAGARRLYMTGEQTVRMLDLNEAHQADERAALELPEVLDVARSPASAGDLIGVANGDLLVVRAGSASLHLAGVLVTEGIARTVVADPTRPVFYVGDGTGGVLIVQVTEPVVQVAEPAP